MIAGGGAEVAQQVLHPLHHVLATSRNGLMNNLRVGEHQVCRADSIQELAQIKHQLMLLVLIQTSLQPY